MIAYKLLRVRKDGSLGSLFINRRQRLPMGVWLQAEEHPTKGFAFRPDWHCCAKPKAPHLSKEDRIWAVVDIRDVTPHERPASQGGLWYTANRMLLVDLL